MTLNRALTARLMLVSLAAALALSACSTARRAGDAINPFNDRAEKDAATEAEKANRIAFLAIDEELAPDEALAGAAITPPADYVNVAWPVEGGYANHAVTHPRVGNDLKRVWSRDLGKGDSHKTYVASPPVIADGKVFAVDGDGDVTAYAIENGQRQWRARMNAEARRDRESRGGGVAYSSGKVFVTTGFGAVVALDADSGEEAWRNNVGAPFHAPPTVSDGRVFAISFDGELFALDAETGQVLWTHQSLAEPARILSASTPAVVGDTVVAPFPSGEIVALRVQNGRAMWSEGLTRGGRTTALSSLNDIAGSPVVIGDVVYAVSHSGVLAAIDLRSGQRIWALPVGGIHMPWVAGDYVFVVTNDAQLMCVSRADGRVYWIRELDRYRNVKKRRGRIAWAGPVLAGGRLLVASSDKDLWSFDPQTGETLDKTKIGQPTLIAPVVSNETVFVVTDAARLVALR